MELVNRRSVLWDYAPEEIRELLIDGERIYDFVTKHNKEDEISDFSFMVFPFAKAYEGFLKMFFMDVGLISSDAFYSDDIRIGRILNPDYIKERGNVFFKLCGKGEKGRNISRQLWDAWKRGRNLVFHYFPHNFRRLSYQEATDLIHQLISAMSSAVMHCGLEDNTR